MTSKTKPSVYNIYDIGDPYVIEVDTRAQADALLRRDPSEYYWPRDNWRLHYVKVEDPSTDDYDLIRGPQLEPLD